MLCSEQAILMTDFTIKHLPDPWLDQLRSILPREMVECSPVTSCLVMLSSLIVLLLFYTGLLTGSLNDS